MIYLASDHGGFELKEKVKKWFDKTGVKYIDGGTCSAERCDYPVFAQAAANALLNKKAEQAILICGTGYGMAIAANRFKGVRAFVGTDVARARLGREHNNANVLCLGGRFTGFLRAKKIINAFLTTNFLGERHTARIAMLDEFDAQLSSATERGH